jgi:hypothetical protein
VLGIDVEHARQHLGRLRGVRELVLVENPEVEQEPRLLDAVTRARLSLRA